MQARHDHGTGPIDHMRANQTTSQPVAFPSVQESSSDKAATPADSRAKRFSFKSLKHPLLRVARSSSATRSKAVGEAAQDAVVVTSAKGENQHKDAQRRTSPVSAVKKNQPGVTVTATAKRVARRVSFSPSTDDPPSVILVTNTSRAQGVGKTTLFGVKRTTSAPPPTRRASLDDSSLGRAQERKLHQEERPPRRRSLSFSKTGIHLNVRQHSSLKQRNKDGQHTCNATTSTKISDKGQAVLPRVARQQAIAARHAQVLERIINAGSSVELEELKAKRIKKIGSLKPGQRPVVQQYSVVSPRKVKALKQALLDNDMANGIIGELRYMEIDSTDGDVHELTGQGASPNVSEAQAALRDLAESDGKHRHGRQAQAARSNEAIKHKVRPPPIRAVCLDCTDEEAIRRNGAAKPVGVRRTASEGEENVTAEQVANVAIAVAEVGVMSFAISKLGTWLRIVPAGTGRASGDAVTVVDNAKASPPHEAASTAVGSTVQYTLELGDDIRTGDVKEALADTARLGASGLRIVQPLAGAVAEEVEAQLLPVNKGLGESGEDGEEPGQVAVKVLTLSETQSPVTQGSAAERKTDVSIFTEVSPISLFTSPTATLGTLGAQQAGAFDAMANITAAAIAHSQGGVEAMQDIQPPLDRMAIFVHWWGFELTLPEPSMQYLGTASSVSSAFLGFLQTMVTTGGVPELLPFIRYISSFMDMEFSAIKSQDKDRRGVVVAATWLMPLALVPRPWDYGYGDGQRANRPASSPTPAASSAPAKKAQPSHPPQLQPVSIPFFPVRFSAKASSLPAALKTKVASQSESSTSKYSVPLSECTSPLPTRSDVKIHSHPPVAGATHSTSDHVLDSVQELSEGGSVRIK